MKVTRDMLHGDLQSTYGLASAMAGMLRHAWVIRVFNFLGRVFRRRKALDGFRSDEYFIDSSDGTHQLRLLVYRPEGVSEKLPVLLYIHGGGYVLGNPEQAVEYLEIFLRTRPCVVIAPDYRKSFTRPFPAGFDDCYDTLHWAREHAEELNILAERFMVVGHSAGGGLAAAVSLKARDSGDVDIAFQMPIYPMIDDTQPSDPGREMDSPVWNSRTNKLGWDAYLSDLHQSGASIPAYAAPARAEDYRDLPPTVTVVGTLEPFHRETLAYVEALRQADVDVTFEEFEGCYHAFDMFGGDKGISGKARAFTFDNFAVYYDRYVAADS